MRLHHGPLHPDDDPALDLAVAYALVRQVARGEVPDTVRIYRPPRPVLVLGRRDSRLPGSSRAVAAARRGGFTPLVRATGGRAVAYTNAALVIDEARREANSAAGMDQRFVEFGNRFVDLLRAIGVDARLGPVPGEYCPGAQSVNARGTVKLVGTSQRVVGNGWLFSSLLVLDDRAVVRPVLEETYRCLELPFDASSVGSVAGEVPGIAADAVETSVVRAWAAGATAEPVAESTLALARELAPHHRL